MTGDAQLLAAGLGSIIGAILALTGAGGGILAVPLLVFGLGLSVAQAAPVGLLAVGLAAAVGAAIGLRQGIVRYRAALFIAAIGVMLTPFGLWLAHLIPNRPLALGFAAVMVLACLRIYRKAALELHHGQPLPRAAFRPCAVNPLVGRLRWTLPCARSLALTGVLSGLLSGLLGVGGGFVIVPALTRYTDLDLKSITATSLAVIALVSTGSVLAASLGGRLQWPVGVPFASGAVAGLLVGMAVARRLRGPRLQQMFAVSGLLAAVLLMVKALG